MDGEEPSLEEDEDAAQRLRVLDRERGWIGPRVLALLPNSNGGYDSHEEGVGTDLPLVAERHRHEVEEPAGCVP